MKIYHHIVAMRERLNEKVQNNKKEVNIELSALRMERDERDEHMIPKCLKNWASNMWHSDQPISSIETGEIADK